MASLQRKGEFDRLRPGGQIYRIYLETSGTWRVYFARPTHALDKYGLVEFILRGYPSISKLYEPPCEPVCMHVRNGGINFSVCFVSVRDFTRWCYTFCAGDRNVAVCCRRMWRNDWERWDRKRARGVIIWWARLFFISFMLIYYFMRPLCTDRNVSVMLYYSLLFFYYVMYCSREKILFSSNCLEYFYS